MTAVMRSAGLPGDAGDAAAVPGRHAAGRWWRRRPGYLKVLAFVVVLAAGAALRLWHLSSSPAWQWDEAVYYRVASNVQHGVLAEHPLLLTGGGQSPEPFLYQPPFYFLCSRDGSA